VDHDRTPDWWLNTLSSRLSQRAGRLEKFHNYYNGMHDLPDVPVDLRNEFQQMLTQSRSNFMRLVVDSVEDRLGIAGFRVASEADEVDDQDAWRIWQANNLDLWSSVSFVESLVKETSYLSVWGDGGDTPRIAVEDALSTIVAHEPGNIRNRLAALKVWDDEWTGGKRANVYLPDGIYKYEKPEHGFEWNYMEDDFVPNPLGIVPIVPMPNSPNVQGDGRSELDEVIPIQDRINKTLWDRMIASEFGAFPHRWALGVDLDDDEDREARFSHVMNRMWSTSAPKAEAEFGQFPQLQLEPYVEAIEQDVLHVAVITRTPRHYLIQQGQSPSGDALRSAETGLVAKAKRKQVAFGEAWEETMRLARMFANLPDAGPDSEVVWRDPEYQTVGQLTDAVIKQVQSGLIDVRTAQEKLGYTPTQIRRMESGRLMQQLFAAAAESE
jgi:hypothetical protein